ncbi:MAG: hypothetical protein ABSA26_07880, partial [Thermoguttaceae bacterium]
MRFKPALFSIGLLLLFLCVAPSFFAIAEDKTDPEEAVFEMREVSAFDKTDSSQGRSLTRGQYAPCSTEPDKEVKVYPKLQSKHPLYGKVKFHVNGSSDDPHAGIEFHFVLDESGQAPENDETTEDKTAEEKKPDASLLKSLSEKLFGAGGDNAARQK